MKISVIVPIYNTERNSLIKCIESILSQSYKDIELVLVDDCSFDKECITICEKYANYDKRVIVASNKTNLGPGVARNKGIELSKGEYISFVDSDDWLEKDAYEQQIAFLKENKLDTVIFDYNRFYNEHRINIKRNIDKDFEYFGFNSKLMYYLLLTTELNGPCYILYNKKIIDKFNIRFPQNMSIGEDLLFNCEYFQYSQHGKHLVKGLYNYKFNNNSLTNSFRISKFNDLKKTYIVRKNLIEKLLVDSSEKKDYIDDLNDIYFCDIFRLVCQGLYTEIRKKDIDNQLSDKTISFIISAKSKFLKVRIMKFLIRKKNYCFIKLIYTLKKKLHDKY